MAEQAILSESEQAIWVGRCPQGTKVCQGSRSKLYIKPLLVRFLHFLNYIFTPFVVFYLLAKGLT